MQILHSKFLNSETLQIEIRIKKLSWGGKNLHFLLFRKLGFVN